MTDNSATKILISSVRVLVVDDNESIAKTFGWMIEALGYEVKVAHDGFTAFAIALSFVPHVVFLDIGLPGMNGYEVCQKIRAEPALTKCTLVAQTGWGQPEHLERSRQAGFDHHWIKPIPIERLEQLFSSLNPQIAAA